ncbi:MAG: three-Cys-motif partner protein TcmP [Planctomycetota bacterium]|nr:three-Cys-motif partner protein TcmP [Planctomycetota bacterium]
MVPHTAAKHLLLKLYLDRWFPILGKFNTRLNYIDGFAGPGEYAGGEAGSPIIAVKSALAHVQKGTLSSSVKVTFVFVERNEAFAHHLREQLAKLRVPSQFSINVVDGEFAAVISEILDGAEDNNKQLAPTFAFVDPFGFSGIPFDLMRRILAYPKCEVFINVMVEFINRFLAHPDEAVVSHFPITFGTDEVLKIPTRSQRRVGQILDLYRRQLAQYASFVGRFDMKGKKDQQTYSLFFASNDPKGFLKMKEANWSVDKSTGSQFSDAFARQSRLFEAMGVEGLWDLLAEKFRDQTVPMTEIEQFVTENTDFIPAHARSLLAEHEEEEDISVIPQPGYNRRKGTFRSDKVSIRFDKPKEKLF